MLMLTELYVFFVIFHIYGADVYNYDQQNTLYIVQ